MVQHERIESVRRTEHPPCIGVGSTQADTGDCIARQQSLRRGCRRATSLHKRSNGSPSHVGVRHKPRSNVLVVFRAEAPSAPPVEPAQGLCCGKYPCAVKRLRHTTIPRFRYTRTAPDQTGRGRFLAFSVLPYRGFREQRPRTCKRRRSTR